MSQKQLEVLGWHSATQIIKTLEHLETRRQKKKTLAGRKRKYKAKLGLQAHN